MGQSWNKIIHLPEEIKTTYLENAVRKNIAILWVLGPLIILTQIFNILRVLFTSVGLSTWNNRFYFGMYCLLVLGVSATFGIYLFWRKKTAYLQRLIVGIWTFCLVWQAVLNAYDVYKNAQNGITILTTAIFSVAVLAQIRPVFSVGMITFSYLLFISLTWDILDTGAHINLTIATVMGIFISVTRYYHVVTELIQQKQITDMNRQLLVEQEKLRLSLEKHQIVMAQTNDILFEWDIPGDQVNFSPNWQEKFGYPLRIPNFYHWIQTEARLSQSDRNMLLQTMNEVCLEQPYMELELTLIDIYGTAEWYRIRLSLQYDQNHKPTSGIGILMDINRQKTELIQLQSIAQRDALTGILNKKALQDYAQTCLANLELHENLAMLIIDVDNFKSINDTYGHPCGDYVLAETAKLLRRIFREEDGIGRIGGDEFAVILTGELEKDPILKKTQQILAGLSKINWPDSNLNVSCSIGAAIFPKQDLSYEFLYQKADEALYKAKEQGKQSAYLYYNGDFHADSQYS